MGGGGGGGAWGGPGAGGYRSRLAAQHQQWPLELLGWMTQTLWGDPSSWQGG